MPKFKTPISTGLNHALRWIVTGQRFLSYSDSIALHDHPDVEGEEYEQAKQELLLAIRQGLINVTGNLEVFDSRHSVFEDYFIGYETWNKYLKQYADRVTETDKGYIFVGHGIEIPPDLWLVDLVDWHSNCLRYSEGKYQARFLTCHVSSENLLMEFSEIENSSDEEFSEAPNQIKIGPDSFNISEPEKRSLLKIIAAMAVRGYRFNPTVSRNKATAEIAEDLELIGSPMDQKTILKWLRESTTYISPEYRFDDD